MSGQWATPLLFVLLLAAGCLAGSPADEADEPAFAAQPWMTADGASGSWTRRST